MKKTIKKYIQKLPRRKVAHFEGFCANCEHPVNGSYCSNCGQSVKDFHRPFFSVVSESLGDALSLDNRLFHTLLPLIARPGFITKEFMKGRRARYTPPFRLYLFLTFFAFLLLSYNHKPETESENKIAIDTSEEEQLDVVSFLEELISKDSINANDIEIGDTLKKGLFNFDIDINPQDEDEISDSLAEKKAIRGFIEMWRLNPNLIIDMAFKKLSQLLLVILPVFALFLALFYIRKKHYLLEHLLISLNFHSFIFVIVIVIELLIITQIEAIQSFALYLYLLIPLQLFLTLKLYYQQSWIKTTIKFLFLSFIYNILLILGVFLALLSFVVE